MRLPGAHLEPRENAPGYNLILAQEAEEHSNSE